MTRDQLDTGTHRPVSWTTCVWRFLNFVWCSIYRHEYRRVEGVGEGIGERTHWHCRKCYDYRVGHYLKGQHCRGTVHVDELMTEDLNDV